MNIHHMKGIELEKYREYSFKKDLKYIRSVLLLGALLYALFGVIDYLYYPSYVTYFLQIRFHFVIPIVLLSYIYSYHKSFKYIYQYVLMAATYVAGIGIIMMIIEIEGENYYFSGLFLVFALNFFMVRLKTIYSSMCAGFILLSFVFISIFFSGIDISVILITLIFYLSFCFIGVMGSRYFEQYRLNQYYQETIITGEKIVLEKQIYKQYEETKNYHTATILTLAKLAESRDLMTGNHINKVSNLAFLLANKLPASFYKENKAKKKDFIEVIKLASSLHDIGKIAISDTILNKPGKLTSEEFEIIKTHTTIGYEMLKEMQHKYKDNLFIDLGLQISRSHHERWDGKGYPDGLKGKETPLAARIVAVVDVFDALVSERSYKKAFSREKSLSIIKEGIGNHFDPIVASEFIDLMQSFKDESF
ncbi:MAG: HD domain-containing protein [Acholeplasmataceae bacterium]|nr:HD domain-containing protein [Acholeplasmataceae bacterium]